MERNDHSWNREKLYSEIWEQPASRVAKKYGVSDVLIGKVCRKLKIPVPGRGYWARKQAGYKVQQIPLPKATNITVIQRSKFPAEQGKNMNTAISEPEPTDAEYLRIVQVEAQTIPFEENAVRHKLISSSAKILTRARADNKGILHPPYDQRCVDIRVSQQSLNRALAIMNSVINALEAEGYPVTLTIEGRGTGAQIFGRRAEFEIVEKLRQKGRREEKYGSYTHSTMEYEPNGLLEFRTHEHGHSPSQGIRDGKKWRIEDELSKCVGLVMRESRRQGIWAEAQKQREIEQRKKDQERAELYERVSAEEKKLKEFEDWVAAWNEAQKMRDFIAELEKVWMQHGHDLSPGTSKAQRLIWMKQQADRKDPLVDSPPSILDRKRELHWW